MNFPHFLEKAVSFLSFGLVVMVPFAFCIDRIYGLYNDDFVCNLFFAMNMISIMRVIKL